LYPAGLADNLMPTAYARRHQLTFWFSVPTMAASLQRLGQLKPNSLPDLRYVLFCGEALNYDVVRGFQQGAPQAQVDNLYGPTEATIAFTIESLGQVGDEQVGLVPIGRAFEGLEVAVVDDSNQMCEAGQKGELLLGGDQLALGYWQRDDLTAKAFIELDLPQSNIKRWYRSGDLASINADGHIAFYGRIDNQIKIRGYRIELQEVEQWIAKALAVDVVAAVAVYDELNAQAGDSAIEIEAYVLQPSDQEPFDSDEASLLAKCKAFLPAYMMPSKIVCVSSMPTNASGKLDRKQLAQMK
jgi:acyl-coenzyme A synthetase/AMP-(fatty) acid ligase